MAVFGIGVVIGFGLGCLILTDANDRRIIERVKNYFNLNHRG